MSGSEKVVDLVYWMRTGSSSAGCSLASLLDSSGALLLASSSGTFLSGSFLERLGRRERLLLLLLCVSLERSGHRSANRYRMGKEEKKGLKEFESPQRLDPGTKKDAPGPK